MSSGLHKVSDCRGGKREGSGKKARQVPVPREMLVASLPFSQTFEPLESNTGTSESNTGTQQEAEVEDVDDNDAHDAGASETMESMVDLDLAVRSSDAAPAALPQLMPPSNVQWNQIDSPERLLAALKSSHVSLDVIVADMRDCFCAMMDSYTGDVADDHIINVVLHDVKASGVEDVEEELKMLMAKIVQQWGANAKLPCLKGLASMWRAPAGTNAQLRITQLILSDLEANIVMMKRLPSSVLQDATYLSTANLHVKSNGEVLEHAAVVTALMPHDLCCSPLNPSEINERSIDTRVLLPFEGTRSMTLHANLNRTLCPLLWERMRDEVGWRVDASRARHSTYRATLYLRFVNGLYYMKPTLAIELHASDLCSGAHAFAWWTTKKNETHLKDSQIPPGVPILMDDHIPICFFDATVIMKGTECAVNTGTFDKYIEQHIKKDLSRDYGSDQLNQGKWKGLAKGVYPRNKEELSAALSYALHLRNCGLSAPSPSPLHVNLLMCSGEAYILAAWNQHIQLCNQQQRWAETAHSIDFETQHVLWILDPCTQTVITDSAFTRNGREGSDINIGDLVAVFATHSTSLYDDTRRPLWLISHKVKNGGSGHYVKNAKGMAAASPWEIGRGEWAEKCGSLGVACLAAKLVSAEFKPEWLTAKLISIRKHGLTPFNAVSYQLLAKQFPKATDPTKLKPNGLDLLALNSCSFHSKPPKIQNGRLSFHNMPDDDDSESAADSDGEHKPIDRPQTESKREDVSPLTPRRITRARK